MKVNKNSITIIVERFIDALEATIEFEEKKGGEERKKKKESRKDFERSNISNIFQTFYI